jgi:hypothetical protein
MHKKVVSIAAAALLAALGFGTALAVASDGEFPLGLITSTGYSTSTKSTSTSTAYATSSDDDHTTKSTSTVHSTSTDEDHTTRSTSTVHSTSTETETEHSTTMTTKPPPTSTITVTTVTKPPPTSTITVTTAPPVSQQPQCKLRKPQPAEPLELNTVAAGSQAKTVVMEKEILDCTKQNGGVQVRDLQTFIEVFEQATAGGVSVSGTRVYATMCVQDMDVGTVNCTNSTVPLGPTLSRPLAGCVPSDDQPEDPVQMNSKGIGAWFKTVSVEKEILFCPNGGVDDLYLFTELVSDNPPTGSPSTRTFAGILCVKHPSNGTPVDQCNRIATS